MYRDWWKPGLRGWHRYPEGQVPSPNGEETFVTIQRFPSPGHAPGESHLAPFYADLDGELERVCQEALVLVGYLSDLLELPPEATRLYFTGGRGIHLEVPERALGVTDPAPDLTYVYGRWARELASRLFLSTLDLGVYSARRMWRQTGSRHRRTGLFKVEVSPADLLRGPEHLRHLAGRPRPPLPYPEPDPVPAAVETLREHLEAYRCHRASPAREPAFLPAGYSPPCVQQLLHDYWQGTGKSNRALLFLAAWACASGMAQEEAAQLAATWLERAPAGLFASPPRDRRKEAEKVVRCVYRHPGKYTFACRFARSLELCAERTCPYGHTSARRPLGPA